MTKFLVLVASLGLIAAGCGSNPSNEAPPALNPNAGPSVSDSGQHTTADKNEIQAMVDLAEYPGAEIVENTKVVSDSIAPDESRFILVRKTKDAPDKVRAYYVKELDDKSGGKPGTPVLGRTPKGNFVQALVEPDGGGSKITLKIISYAKK